jgi:two-component system response regulator YesN
MQPVFDSVKDQYHKEITTKEMAAKVNMSVPYFCAVFKKLTGRSLHDYLRSVRIAEAIKLLVSGNDSIKQIASMVGYDNVNYFTRIFKKDTGISPAKYREKYLASFIQFE